MAERANKVNAAWLLVLLSRQQYHRDGKTPLVPFFLGPPGTGKTAFVEKYPTGMLTLALACNHPRHKEAFLGARARTQRELWEGLRQVSKEAPIARTSVHGAIIQAQHVTTTMVASSDQARVAQTLRYAFNPDTCSTGPASGSVIDEFMPLLPRPVQEAMELGGVIVLDELTRVLSQGDLPLALYHLMAGGQGKELSPAAPPQSASILAAGNLIATPFAAALRDRMVVLPMEPHDMTEPTVREQVLAPEVVQEDRDPVRRYTRMEIAALLSTFSPQAVLGVFGETIATDALVALANQTQPGRLGELLREVLRHRQVLTPAQAVLPFARRLAEVLTDEEVLRYLEGIEEEANVEVVYIYPNPGQDVPETLILRHGEREIGVAGDHERSRKAVRWGITHQVTLGSIPAGVLRDIARAREPQKPQEVYGEAQVLWGSLTLASAQRPLSLPEDVERALQEALEQVIDTADDRVKRYLQGDADNPEWVVQVTEDPYEELPPEEMLRPPPPTQRRLNAALDMLRNMLLLLAMHPSGVGSREAQATIKRVTGALLPEEVTNTLLQRAIEALQHGNQWQRLFLPEDEAVDVERLFARYRLGGNLDIGRITRGLLHGAENAGVELLQDLFLHGGKKVGRSGAGQLAEAYQGENKTADERFHAVAVHLTQRLMGLMLQALGARDQDTAIGVISILTDYHNPAQRAWERIQERIQKGHPVNVAKWEEQFAMPLIQRAARWLPKEHQVGTDPETWAKDVLKRLRDYRRRFFEGRQGGQEGPGMDETKRSHMEALVGTMLLPVILAADIGREKARLDTLELLLHRLADTYQKTGQVDQNLLQTTWNGVWKEALRLTGIRQDLPGDPQGLVEDWASRLFRLAGRFRDRGVRGGRLNEVLSMFRRFVYAVSAEGVTL